MSYSRKKSNTEEFIQKAKKIHGEKYNYEKTEYKLAKEKVVITCLVHGDFEINANNFLQGKGCKKCGHIEKGLKKRSGTDSFIEKAIKVHGNKYDYSSTHYEKSLSPVVILCKVHGFFTQMPSAHLSGSGCTECGKINTSLSKKLSKEDFIQRAKETHGILYDYSKVEYLNIHKKIIICCPIHGDFEQEPNSHIQGSGCPMCAKDVRALKKTKSFTDFIEIANKIHNNKYKYLEDTYTKASEKVGIECEYHGLFYQSGNSHLSGNGCKRCGINSRVQESKNTIEDFINKGNIKYNGKYDYSKFIYTNVDTKSTIVCPVHGEFKQTPYLHLNSKIGCNKCAVDINAEKCRKLPKELARLKKNFSRRAKSFLRKNKNIRKREEFTSVLGCNWEQFKEHLENNPYNYTIDCSDLDLDHIVPISDAVDEDSFYNLCHYSNFQLLPRVYNQHIKRANKFDREHFEKWLIDTNYNSC